MAAPFKAYDIRGLVPEELSPGRARLIGLALAHELFGAAQLPSSASAASSRLIVVSRDMREHSPELSAALIQGLCQGGCDVLDIGLAATPMNYWANVHFNARGSVQVTASHNGARYNGFKVSGPSAVPLDYSTGLDRVEKRVLGWEQAHTPRPSASSAEPGTVRVEAEVLSKYLSWMDAFLTRDGSPLRVGVDAGNGMGGFFLPGWFGGRGWLELKPLFFELDGRFPNHEADPLKAENLRDVQALVTRERCDFGAAFDGDADRCMFVDENGAAISSDLITALIAAQVLEETPGCAILYDLRSSRAVPEWISEHGGRPIRERVGHTFMKRTLRESGARFGGELSGHYYFQDCFNTDSGLMALVQIVNILQQKRQPLSQLVAPLRRYAATGEINFRVPDAPAAMREIARVYEQQGARLDDLDGLSVDFEDWWFSLRSSNTEPLLRLNLEAPSAPERDRRLGQVRAIILAQGGQPADGAH